MIPASVAASSSSPEPKAERLGDAIGASAVAGVGVAMGAVATLGAMALPLMALSAATGDPTFMAGQQVVASGGAAAVAGLSLLAIPGAKAGLRGAMEMGQGQARWQALKDSPLGQKALALSDKMGGLRGAVSVAATSAIGLAAGAAGFALTGSHGAAMASALVAGQVALSGAAAIDALRETRQAAGSDLAQRRANRGGGEGPTQGPGRGGPGPR